MKTVTVYEKDDLYFINGNTYNFLQGSDAFLEQRKLPRNIFGFNKGDFLEFGEIIQKATPEDMISLLGQIKTGIHDRKKRIEEYKKKMDDEIVELHHSLEILDLVQKQETVATAFRAILKLKDLKL